MADSTAALVGISFGAVLLLLWWSPARAFDRWVTAIVLVGLVIGAIVTLVLSGRQELELQAASADPSESDPEHDPVLDPEPEDTEQANEPEPAS